MKKNALLTSLALVLAIGLTSCLKEPKVVDVVKLNLPEQAYNYASVEMPFHMQNEFRANAPTVFINNDTTGGVIIDPGFGFEFGFEQDIPFNPQVTDHGATLGRVLFYDTKLSLNDAVACASCHKQEFAFADPTTGSQGFEGKVTPRNSMAIVNVALNRNLFWDSRVQSAKELTLKPVQNHIEMGMEDLSVLVNKLAKTDYYPTLFNKAFGNSQITEERISDALAQFLCSMVSVDSRFDALMNGDGSAMTDLEMMGMEVFFRADTKCSQCHSGNNFMADDRPGGPYGDAGFGSSGNGPKGTANNGLDINTADAGLRNGQFRIPSLRNIALTGPYMHDGRFKTLEEVVEFYNSGIKLHPNLDKKLIGDDGEPIRMNLSSLEKKALVAFMESLSDQSLVVDEKFSNPFK